MLAVSAEAKTSAGAPWVICCTSADEASKLKVALASGLASVKASPTAVNDSVSEAAANTVMSPSTAGAVVVAVVAAAVVAAAVVAARGRGGRRRRGSASSSSPQAAARRARTATETRSRRDGLDMASHCSQDFMSHAQDLTTLAPVAPTVTVRRAPARPATPRAVPTEPSFAEWVCLTLVNQKVSHGWALGTMLAPDGELGRIWTLSRPLTYRAIDGLVDKRLITRRGPGRRTGS